MCAACRRRTLRRGRRASPSRRRRALVIHGLTQMIARATTPPSRKPRRETLSTTGRPPSPTARRWPRPRPSSCSSGRKNPGASTKVANHSDDRGVKFSLPPTAFVPIWKNRYVATPATSRAAATGIVPSGNEARSAVTLETGLASDTACRGYRRVDAEGAAPRSRPLDCVAAHRGGRLSASITPASERRARQRGAATRGLRGRGVSA